MYWKLADLSALLHWAMYPKMKMPIDSTWVIYLVLIWQMTSPVMAQTERPISFSEHLLDAVSCGGTDTFTFEANANDVVVIHVVELSDFGGVCGRACFCFDQQVELLDATGTTVLAVNTSPTSGNDRRRYRTQIGPERLPSSGTYTVKIRDKQNNGRGEYAIFLQRINAPERAEPIFAGDDLLFTLNRGEVDSFVFEAWPLDLTRINMTPDAIGNVEPVLELYNQEGQALALPDSGSIEYVFGSGGTFTLLAFSRVDEQGSYRLNISLEMPPNNEPVAVDDTATTLRDTPVAIDVLANDGDQDGDSLIIATVTQGANGSVVNNGSYLVYTPNAGFIGTEVFNYEATDRRDSTTAEVTVTVMVGTATETEGELPTEFALMGNYPNPFNPMTTIRFMVPESAQVKLVVSDVSGRQVRVLVDEMREAGTHEVVFEADALPSGTYLYRLETPAGSFVQSMQLVK